MSDIQTKQMTTVEEVPFSSVDYIFTQAEGGVRKTPTTDILTMQSDVKKFTDNITFITDTLTATNEENFCLELFKKFLATGATHAFVSAIWENNDYFTGTISRYATSSALGVIIRGGSAKTLVIKSNGSTITKNTITYSS